jgi:hypothetical protein
MVSRNKSKKNVSHKTSTTQDDYSVGQKHKIALAAYYKAENRGFFPGQELNDWLEAEHEIMGKP